MPNYEVVKSLEQLNRSMVQLRDSMKGMQIRTAGFKRLHDETARKVATFSVHAAEYMGDMMPK